MPEQVDVVIVGAGISGVAAAYYLGERCPRLSWTILEARDDIGGTWDLFRYPGVRSDSEMYTLGFSFRPWRGEQAIADGPAILQYIRDSAREYGIDRKIRFGHRVHRIAWTSAAAEWRLDIARPTQPEKLQLRCKFLFMCSGYYRYDEGYTPALARPGARPSAAQSFIHKPGARTRITAARTSWSLAAARPR